MKSITCVGLASLFILSACSTMGRPYIAGDTGCDEIIDARERLDCYDRAEQVEDDWRAEQKRKKEDKEKTDQD